MINNVKIFLNLLKSRGVRISIELLFNKLSRKKIKEYQKIKDLFYDKYGLEIGGPTGTFRKGGFVPIYHLIKDLDGCNFSNNTIWEGEIIEQKNYHYGNEKTGFQYILEATDLNKLPDEKYDFVISSNCLEHIANPLKAMKEWIRVLKDGGILFLALPNKKYNFDHQRPFTLFSHILADYQNNIGEDDLTHLNEILALHDLKRDLPAGSAEQFKQRSLDNFHNRALHHHVYHTDLLKEIYHHFNLEVIYTVESKDYFIIGRKRIKP